MWFFLFQKKFYFCGKYYYLSMKKDKSKNKKKLSLAKTLRSQADKKNEYDCKPILSELDDASKQGEYSRTLQLKVNQSEYLKTLGLKVTSEEKFGYYKISW